MSIYLTRINIPKQHINILRVMMNSKYKRQEYIRELIQNGSYHTHREVQKSLRVQGVHVNQGTLSKDFKDLHVTKARLDDGRYRYELPPSSSLAAEDGLVERELREFVVSVDDAMHQVILKTSAGRASGLCETLDQAGWPEIVGSVAGENTVLLITKSNFQARKLLKQIKYFMKGKGG